MFSDTLCVVRHQLEVFSDMFHLTNDDIVLQSTLHFSNNHGVLCSKWLNDVTIKCHDFMRKPIWLRYSFPVRVIVIDDLLRFSSKMTSYSDGFESYCANEGNNRSFVIANADETREMVIQTTRDTVRDLAHWTSLTTYIWKEECTLDR